MLDTFKKNVSSVEETLNIGRKIAALAKPGDVILLKGDLGSGKTTLVKGVGEGLGVIDPVISPTFNILKCYFKGRLPMYHIDGYRLEGQNLDIGLEEAIYGDGIAFVEWPQFLTSILPADALLIAFTKIGEGERELAFSCGGSSSARLLEELENEIG